MKRILLAICAVCLIPGLAVAQVPTDHIARWKFDEASGNAIDDAVGNDLTETTGTIASAAGIVGGARDNENADSEYFTRADNADLSTGDIDFTFCIWVKPESVSGTFAIAAKGSWSATQEWYLHYTSSVNRFQFVAGAASGIVSADNLGAASPGVWYFIVCWHDTTDTNTINIQINDGAVDSVAYTLGITDSTGPFAICEHPALGRYWDGLVDDAWFFKRVLTTGEKTSLYELGQTQSQAPRSLHQFRLRSARVLSADDLFAVKGNR